MGTYINTSQPRCLKLILELLRIHCIQDDDYSDFVLVQRVRREFRVESRAQRTYAGRMAVSFIFFICLVSNKAELSVRGRSSSNEGLYTRIERLRRLGYAFWL